MTVGNIQLELINKAKKYLEKKSNEDINVHSSGRCYFLSWAATPGYAILKFVPVTQLSQSFLRQIQDKFVRLFHLLQLLIL